MSKNAAKAIRENENNAPRFRSADEEFDEQGMPIYHDTLLGTMKSLWRFIGKYKKKSSSPT